ncbi:hypothetical protein [Streptomyces tsukubensis]|uniref:Uncharacterized protein n=1 Tax=Streptomyces tsukubensis TaxID=83656 RepID=A0A1V3ZZJ7_9ACTN|nr:hypothetical protein [Streptomyces tsukubensis]OON71929.1 hypothetical protein B1H18_31725 [Streptomyces tsukubensis]QFR96876.1 hypothetical protein GBW32_32320 [Streptomyces tsukubensis]
MTTSDVISLSDADVPRHGHRFLLIGTDTIFVYHLALYHVAVHAFQMITKFGLDEGVRKKYLDDLSNHEDQQVYYSLFSEGHWPLKEIVDGTRDSLPVELERVTVDSGGNRTFTKIVDETTATCRKQDVVHYRPLDATDYPDSLTCLAFGAGFEIHLAHQLAASPNWDEVITTAQPTGFQQSDLDHAAAVTVPAVKDPKGVVTTSPLEKGKPYKGLIETREVTFTAGRQGWWNHTSLNDK